MEFIVDLDGIISDKIDDINKRTGLDIQIDDSEVSKRLQKLFNLKFKMISQKTRNVHYSSELRDKTLKEPYASALKEIEDKFKNKGDLNPYLSRHAFDPEFQDGLLNDWALHHLHLSVTKDKKTKYLYSRSGCLLFVAVGPNDVYFLDIRPHNESYRSNPEYPLWVRNEFLEIIDTNWSFLLEKYKINGFSPAKTLSKEEILEFRENNYYTFVQIGTNVYTPFGGGLTYAGIGGRQIRNRNGLLNDIGKHQRNLSNNPDKIKDLMKKNGFEPSDDLDFKLIDSSNGLACLEQNTGFELSLGPIKDILNIY